VFNALAKKVATFRPQLLIFWCPTCQCRFGKTYATIKEYSFSIQSLPQFITANLDKLDIETKHRQTVTVHEACKAALTGLDELIP
jgi:hypothetical protein